MRESLTVTSKKVEDGLPKLAFHVVDTGLLKFLAAEKSGPLPPVSGSVESGSTTIQRITGLGLESVSDSPMRTTSF